MSSPTVSVILPVFNGANYVRLAVDSVLNQTFRNFELIVVDDGSTDSTPEILRSYGTRLKFVRKENGGVATAFNRGIRESSGRYISWLSHDDLFEPTKLEMQVKAVSDWTGPRVCYTDACFIDPDGIVIKELEVPDHAPGELLRNLLVSGPIALAAYSLFFDRRCVDEVGMYDEAQLVTQDADMLIRLARRFPFKRVPQKLIRIREHVERSSLDKRWMSEALKFYIGWSDRLSLEELFPESGGESTNLQRARQRVWLGDKYANNVLYRKLAMRQYAQALRESPAILPTATAKIARLLSEPARRFANEHRSFHRLGLRTALAGRFAQAKRKLQ